MAPERVWLSSPHMGDKEQFYVGEAFKTNWIAPLGPNVDAFEKQLTDFLAVNGTVSLSSGTGALHLALKILGVKATDVVLCQSFTFAASAFPITYCGAIPVFVDSEKDTWNIDPQLMESAIADLTAKGKKPAAIIVVHLYGMPAKMDEILEIAARFQIPVIEDAAEALGSTYNGKACGSIGDMAILSFNGNKIITTSGGGALTSNNPDFISKARHLSAQAKDPAAFYLHTEIGYNYRLSNVLAGIGRGQMEVLEQRVNKRRKIFEFYKKELGTIDGLSFPEEPAGSYSNRWLTTILLDKKLGPGVNEQIRLTLEKLHIETRALWKPLHQQPVFESNERYLNGVADELFATGLCLPSGSNTSEANLEKVVFEIKKFLS